MSLVVKEKSPIEVYKQSPTVLVIIPLEPCPFQHTCLNFYASIEHRGVCIIHAEYGKDPDHDPFDCWYNEEYEKFQIQQDKELKN